MYVCDVLNKQMCQVISKMYQTDYNRISTYSFMSVQDNYYNGYAFSSIHIEMRSKMEFKLPFDVTAFLISWLCVR